MIFMHKDQPIAEASVNSGRFSVYKLLSDRELPVGTMTQTRQLLELSLSNWYSSRAIPGLRQSLWMQCVRCIGAFHGRQPYGLLLAPAGRNGVTDMEGCQLP